jgi:hypothetical protein
MGFNSGLKGLMKVGSSRQIFEKYSNIKFHKYPSSGKRGFHADRHDEANSRFSQLRERA